MPSFSHELPLELFRQCPELVAYLLGEVLGAKLPPFEKVRVEETDFTQVVPAEFRADLVVTLRKADVPALGIVFEMQRHPDEDKRFTWPVYLTVLRARIRCDVMLVVFTDDERVARWAAKRVVLGPDWTIPVWVLGPDLVPRVTKADEVRHLLELAVLSAMAHGNKPDGLEVLLATAEVLWGLAAERRNYYYDLMLATLNEATRRALDKELEMEAGKNPYRSEFARTYFAQGEAKGKAEGKAEGEAKALLAVLGARGMAVDDATRERILSCTDLNQLERWVVRAATASSINEVLAEP